MNVDAKLAAGSGACNAETQDEQFGSTIGQCPAAMHDLVPTQYQQRCQR